MREMRSFVRSVGAAALVLAACAGPAPQAPPPGERVESRALGLAIAELPEPFNVTVNGAGALELAAPGGGRLTIRVGEERAEGINLVEAVKERMAWFQAAEGGGYFGNRELMTQIGTAFTARGTYQAEAGPVEETWVFAIHPSANRLLTLTFTYPPGESQERVQQLIALLGELEGIGFRDST